MDTSNSSQETQGKEASSPGPKTEQDVVEELILDYACKNNMHKVISEVLVNRDENWFYTLKIPHLRFVSSTVYSIVHEEAISEYEEALRYIYIINDSRPDLISAKQFVKLIAGIKTKIILGKLDTTFDYAVVCAKLNQFFPKAHLHAKVTSHDQTRLNNYQLSLRRKLTRLIVSPSERQVFQDGIATHELGNTLTTSIQDLVKVFIARFNENLTVPVIEQIASEGPHSQLSRDVQDSPLTCMDHLLSICFKGLPSEEQLLHLLSLTKEERATAAADIPDNLGLSSSSSDEPGRIRSTRIRDAKQGRIRRGTDRHGLSGSSLQNETPRSTRSNSTQRGNTGHVTRFYTTSHDNTRTLEGDTDMCPDDQLLQTPKSRHLTPKSKIYFSTSMNRLSQMQPTQTTSNLHTSNDNSSNSRSREPPKTRSGPTSVASGMPSKIYFSTSMNRVSRSQFPQTPNVHTADDNSRESRTGEPPTISRINKTGPPLVPCGTPIHTHGKSTDQDTVDNGKGVNITVSSQRNSESSGSASSQSTTSVSLLPVSRTRAMKITHREDRTDTLMEEEEESQQHIDYTGSVTVVEETPSSGESNKAMVDTFVVDQCHTVSSSGSSSAHSHSSQNKEKVNEGETELQDSNVSSVYDSLSIISPSPEALESSCTFIRTPLITSQGPANDSPSVASLSSDSDNDSVVSDSEGSSSSLDDEDSLSEDYFTADEQVRRRIPSLKEYLHSPARPGSPSKAAAHGDTVLVIKPCVVLLHKLKVTDTEPNPFLRRSRRLRQKAN